MAIARRTKITTGDTEVHGGFQLPLWTSVYPVVEIFYSMYRDRSWSFTISLSIFCT
jgi:hypothetical protein